MCGIPGEVAHLDRLDDPRLVKDGHPVGEAAEGSKIMAHNQHRHVALGMNVLKQANGVYLSP